MLLIFNKIILFLDASKTAKLQYPQIFLIFSIFGPKRTRVISNFRRWSQLEKLNLINKSPKINENQCKTVNKVEHF